LRQLIVLGGGGFSMEKNRALDRYVLAQSARATPRICFVGTASGDAESYRYKFYEAFATLDCRATHLSLFAPPCADLAGFVAEQDVIFVGGGNTRSLLALWRDWGLDRMLRDAYERGTVVAGISAGMICWFDWGVTDSIPGALTPLRGLGWIAGSACPHYDGEAERRPTLHKLVAQRALPAGIAADDGVAIRYADEAIVDVVSSRDRARAYRVGIRDGAAMEAPISPRVLAPA
jgi:dipeptidase E